MRFVTEASRRPHHCAVFPHLGTAHRRGYFDTGTTLDGPGVFGNHIYISVEAVEAGARELGWVSGTDHAALGAEVEALQAEAERLQAELDARDVVLDSIDVIESADFRARRRSGRPAKEKVA